MENMYDLMEFAQPLMRQGVNWSWMKWQTVVQPTAYDAYGWISHAWETTVWPQLMVAARWLWSEMNHPRSQERSLYALQFLFLLYVVWSSYNVARLLDRAFLQPKAQSQSTDPARISWKELQSQEEEMGRRPFTRSQLVKELAQELKFEAPRRRSARHEFSHGVY